MRLLYFLLFEARTDDGDGDGDGDGDAGEGASPGGASPGGASPGGDNLFLQTFLQLPAAALEGLALGDHVDDRREDKSRSGASLEACAIVLLLAARPPPPGGGGTSPDDLLPEPDARDAYGRWLKRAQGGDEAAIEPGVMERIGAAQPAPPPGPGEGPDRPRVASAVASASAAEDDDPLGRELGLHAAAVLSLESAPSTWSESTAASLLPSKPGAPPQPGRDARREAGERAERDRAGRSDEERARMLSRDPLGIRPEAFDLRSLEAGRQASRRKMSSAAPPAGGDPGDDPGSVLPTDPNFSPLLFLSLVHPKASFPELTKALSRLQGVSDNHAARLQRLVRDNFPLFVRCAEGIDWFADNFCEGDPPDPGGAGARLARLSELAARCEAEADGAFGPLLRNNAEVRRTKNALATLSRVGPILSVPNLMRSHLQAGRVAEAVKAYRRVRLINETCGVELLRSVREKAMEAAEEARASLAKVASSPTATTQQLLVAIRDMSDLDDLDGDAADAAPAPAPFSPQPGALTPQKRRLKNHPLACLRAQAGHFAALAAEAAAQHEAALGDCAKRDRRWREELDSSRATAASVEGILGDEESDGDDGDGGGAPAPPASSPPAPEPAAPASLKSSVHAARVAACQRAALLAAAWLPRLMRVASLAYEKQAQLYAVDANAVDVKVGDVLRDEVAGALTGAVKLVGRAALGLDGFEGEFRRLFPDSQGAGATAVEARTEVSASERKRELAAAAARSARAKRGAQKSERQRVPLPRERSERQKKSQPAADARSVRAKRGAQEPAAAALQRPSSLRSLASAKKGSRRRRTDGCFFCARFARPPSHPPSSSARAPCRPASTRRGRARCPSCPRRSRPAWPRPGGAQRCPARGRSPPTGSSASAPRSSRRASCRPSAAGASTPSSTAPRTAS
jgi:hypothetical protein